MHVGVEHGTSSTPNNLSTPAYLPPSVVLVGHTNCGGAAACYDAACAGPAGAPSDSLGRWLAPLVDLATSLNLADSDRPSALAKLVDANVRKQVGNLVASDVMQKAWAAGKSVRVHGLVYDLASGELKDLGVTQGPPAKA